ncbi:MAG: hypothetical protein JWM16_5627 [Verrucomicrobiales bacterium]|nr:hypothetical protein [Verrucomicrobiales bacterium]
MPQFDEKLVLPHAALVKAAKHERDFIRLVEFSTAVSLGLMTGFLFSIKQVNPRIEFEIDSWSFVACLVSGILIWMACHLFFHRLAEAGASGDLPGSRRRKLLVRWVIFFSGALFLETVLAVARGLRGISPEKLSEVLQGTAFALFVLSIVAFLFWKLTRFIESDTPPPHLRDKNQTD